MLKYHVGGESPLTRILAARESDLSPQAARGV